MNIAKRILFAPAAALVLLAAGPALAAHHEGAHDDAAPDIVEIAAGNQDFSTLVAALKAAGLVETLQGEGPFTVFAPTNAAFAALPEGTVEGLLEPANKAQLTAVTSSPGQCTPATWSSCPAPRPSRAVMSASPRKTAA